jgi:phosphatidylinositol kinase/protein kinase (PI-3  family)
VNSGIKNVFIETFAIYQIIMHVFGVGDRNLDNMLIDNSGRFFHIDYSYIFGEDPRLFKPDLHIPPCVCNYFLSHEDDFNCFLVRCKETFQGLRSNFGRMLLFLSLLKNSPYVKIDHSKVVQYIKSALKLEMSSSESETHLMQLLIRSNGDMKSQIIHIINKIGKAWRM